MPKSFLDKVYQANTPEETRRLYDDWATSYDEEVAAQGYVTPGRVAKAMAQHAGRQSDPILDYGCGTGLSGLALKLEGFGTIDGVDVSPAMLEEARARGIYRDLTQIDPDTPEPLQPGAYRMITATGVIGAGAAPLGVFDILMRALPKQGLLGFSFNDHTLKDRSYEAKLNDWLDCGAARLLFREHGPHLPGANVGACVYVVQKT